MDRRPGIPQKKLILFLACVFAVCSFSAASLAADNAGGLTIETAIQVALDNNKSIQMQKANIKEAEANKLYAISNFLPKAEADYSYTHYDAIFSLPAPGIRKDPGVFQGYEDDNLFSVSVEQVFFNGGAYIANFKQAGLGLTYQRETYRATVLEVEFDIKRLFYGLLLAYEIERIARDLVNQADAHYQEALYKFNQGTASRFDVLQSKVQVSRVMPQLINAKNSIEVTKEELKKALGIDMRQKIEINGELNYKPMYIDEEAFLVEAYEERPEMKLKTLGVDIEKWGIELAKSTGVPQASGMFEYYARSNDISDMVNKRHDNWNIGIKVSVPLFDGLATPAKINEARAKYSHARLDRENYVDQIAVDVKQACLNMEDASAIIAAQKDSVVEAKEALRLAEVRYRTGVGINLDVLDSQVALAEIEQSLAEAIYDYIMAKADLIRVMGREYFKEG